MIFSKKTHDGELFIDHRASPGFTREQAEARGVPYELTKEGAQMHAATLGCPHCGSHVVLNPMRKRERAHCYKCNQYICDICYGVSCEPGYVHVTMNEIREKIATGKWIMAGTMSKPILIPITKEM